METVPANIKWVLRDGKRKTLHHLNNYSSWRMQEQHVHSIDKSLVIESVR